MEATIDRLDRDLRCARRLETALAPEDQRRIAGYITELEARLARLTRGRRGAAIR